MEGTKEEEIINQDTETNSVIIPRKASPVLRNHPSNKIRKALQIFGILALGTTFPPLHGCQKTTANSIKAPTNQLTLDQILKSEKISDTLIEYLKELQMDSPNSKKLSILERTLINYGISKNRLYIYACKTIHTRIQEQLKLLAEIPEAMREGFTKKIANDWRETPFYLSYKLGQIIKDLYEKAIDSENMDKESIIRIIEIKNYLPHICSPKPRTI